jgi:hypothetical protein
MKDPQRDAACMHRDCDHALRSTSAGFGFPHVLLLQQSSAEGTPNCDSLPDASGKQRWSTKRDTKRK